MTFLSPPFPMLVAVVGLFVAVSGCSNEDSRTSRTLPPVFDPRLACNVLSATQILSVTSATMTRDEKASSQQVCYYSAPGGHERMTVTVQRVPDRATFEAMVTATGRSKESAGLGDQAVEWTDTGNTSVILARRGGWAVRLAQVASSPESRLAGLKSLAKLAVAKLPLAPYADTEVVGDAVCGKVPLARLRVEVGLPDLKTSPLGQAAGCALSSTTGVSFNVERLPGDVIVAQLEGMSRSSTVDGTERPWTVEQVDGLGNAARWFVDPAGTGGELDALFGSRVVRITVVAGEGASGLRELAVEVAGIVAPGLLQ